MSSPATELAPWFSADRLVDWLGTRPRAPLTVLWTWPEGGGEDWLAAFAGAVGNARFLPPGDLPSTVGELAAGEIGLLGAAAATELLEADVLEAEDLGTGGLEAAVSCLAPGARLVLAAAPRPPLGLTPAHLVPPRVLALDRRQLSAAVPSAWPSRRLDQLLKVTGGWVGPCRWLLDRAGSADSLEQIFESAAFRSYLEAQILGRLDAVERGLLGRILAVGGEADLAIWRQLVLEPSEDSAQLATLEKLASRWGLVGDQAPPPLLLRALAVDRDRRRLCRRLARAANELGHGAEAASYLGRAGDLAAAERLASLSRRQPPEAAGPEPRRPGRALSRPGASFRVRLFGSPTVARLGPDGQEEELSWRLHRSLLCVARLALAPEHRLARGELIETLWPTAPEDHVRRNFHPTLSCARKALGEGRAGGIVYRQGTYCLDPGTDWQIDAEEFEQRLARAKEAQSADRTELALDVLQDAWRLYRGPLLDGHSAAWVEPRREWMHRRYLDMLERIGELALGSDRITLALDAYRSLLIEEPFEERIHLSVMTIYGRRGRRDLVRRQFVRLQELLKDLHVEPAEETIDRYHQLMG